MTGDWFSCSYFPLYFPLFNPTITIMTNTSDSRHGHVQNQKKKPKQSVSNHFFLRFSLVKINLEDIHHTLE